MILQANKNAFPKLIEKAFFGANPEGSAQHEF